MENVEDSLNTTKISVGDMEGPPYSTSMMSFVCGQLCSGKTLYAKALAEMTDGEYIEVGDIVREIKQSEDRKELQDSRQLDKIIMKRLLSKCIEVLPKQLIVSGVRQKSIIQAFPSCTKVWVECPKNERLRRYLKRRREGDNIPFEEAEKGDIDLGILEVKKFILTNN